MLADGIIGQAMEPVDPTWRMPPRVVADWAVTGADGRPPRVVRSLHLRSSDLERHNRHLAAKADAIAEREVRWAGTWLEDANLVIVAYGTAARIASTAVDRARAAGRRAGLFRPLTLFPFPTADLRAIAARARGILVVELSMGQMIEDVRLAVLGAVPVALHGRSGGSLPTPGEIVGALDRLDRGLAAGVDADWGPDPTSLIEQPGMSVIAAGARDGEPDPLALIVDGARLAVEHPSRR